MRQEAYRVAYDEATAELNEIIAQFDQLQQRKTRLERLAEVLRPLAEIDGASSTAAPLAVEPMQEPHEQTEEQNAVPVQEVQEPAAVAVPQFAEATSDPFQRRINNALRQGFGSGDGREYSRLFSGLSRGH